MIVAIPVGSQHVQQAIKLLNHCAQLDGGSRHPCLLVLAKEIPYEALQELLRVAGRAFCNVSAIKATLPDKRRQPETDRLLFRSAGSYAVRLLRKPFFWLSVESFPSSAGWVDKLESDNPKAPLPNPDMVLDKYPLRSAAFPELFGAAPAAAPVAAPYEVLRPDWPAIKKMSKKWRRDPVITLVYIHVPGDEKHWRYAREFMDTYQKFPPEYPHKTIIVCQGKPAVPLAQGLFKPLNPVYHQHDDSGWDIGGFISAMSSVVPSENTATDCVICLGGSAYFQKAGWLKRIAETHKKIGIGFYGATPTHEVSPHLCTSGFWTHPDILRAYPIKVTNRETRYDFEHGPNACWKMVAHNGLPVKLITWDGEYDWQDWRKPDNIYRKGDQSNALMCWHHYREYEKATPELKSAMANHSDTLTDPHYLALLKPDLVAPIPPQTEAFKEAHGFA